MSRRSRPPVRHTQWSPATHFAVALVLALAGIAPAIATTISDVEPEHLVNDGGSLPHVGMDGSGTAAYCWDAFGEVWVSRDGAAGPVEVETNADRHLRECQVASRTNGTFFVIWKSEGDGGNRLHGRLFGTNLAPMGGVQIISDLPSVVGGRAAVGVTALEDGRFVAVWESTSSHGNDDDGTSIQGRIVNANGVVSAAQQFQANVDPHRSQDEPAVVGTADGGFFVVWDSSNSVGADPELNRAVQGRFFTSTGAPAGAEFQINTTTPERQRLAKLARNGRGEILVVYQSNDLGRANVRARQFAADGTPTGDDFLISVNDGETDQDQPDVAGGADFFLVAWQADEPVSVEDEDVLARVVLGPSAFEGLPLIVNDFTVAGQHNAAVAAHDDRAIVAWSGSNDFPGASPGLVGRYLDFCVECGDPPPPPGPWIQGSGLPGYRAKARITAGANVITGQSVSECIAETLCISGAIATRAEAFVRVVGPKPNGKLWPTMVKFSTSRVEIWLEQTATGVVRYYDLEAVAPGGDILTLDGVADKLGFDPLSTASVAQPTLGLRQGGVPTSVFRAAGPEPPAGPWLQTPAVPGFRTKVRITAGANTIAGGAVGDCIGETLCVSGAVPGRAEIFVRVVGPKPNGRLWPTLVKFSTSRIEVWIEQTSTGERQYYDLAAVAPGDQLLVLEGLADKLGFVP